MSPNAHEPVAVAWSEAATINKDDSASPSSVVTEEDNSLEELPEDLLLEERLARMQREKEAATSHDEATDPSLQQPLAQSRFQHLQSLLAQTGQYTQFLTEQLTELQKVQASPDGKADGMPAAATELAVAGKKRGRPPATGKKGAAKKAKPAEDGPPSPTQELAPGLLADLRDYQLKGVQWLISMWKNGLNGILADQMGLGKTVQVIAFFAHLRAKGIKGPHLVVGPLSVLPNWVSEIKRWLPAMPVLLYHGSREERQQLRDQQLPPGAQDLVVVTSYEILMADVAKLAQRKFKYTVVDEGHRLKNAQCKLFRLLRTIPTQNTLLLTGTPLQNNLGELWSLLHFLLPDVFASLQDFEGWFDFSAPHTSQEAAEQRSAAVAKLHDILKPFVLRRIKADVEISLPAKKEIVLYAQMTALQRRINASIIEKDLGALQDLTDMQGQQLPPAARLNNMLMQLRKNCNHPDLITAPVTGALTYPPPDELAKQCGKMALLRRLLERLRAGGHKVIIFSQMTTMLDLLESFLTQQGHRTCRIDGSVAWQDRQAAIHDFNTDPEAWVFLLSTRAGGLGINLTAADTCIIYDSDWNPQQDLQAMDRCHRIGQTKPVLVMRLATADSCEERMLARAASKMALEQVVMKKGVFKELVDDAGDKKPSSSSSSSGTARLTVQELLPLLAADAGRPEGGNKPQGADVPDELLEQLLDRSHMISGAPQPYPNSGAGYQVVSAAQDGGLLKGVE